MKLENFSDLYFVVSVLVPRFIYHGVILNFVPMRRIKEKEIAFLRYLIATAFNYAICSPLIYLLAFSLILRDRPIGQAACWFTIIFLVPLFLGLIHARILQRDSLRWLCSWVEGHAYRRVPDRLYRIQRVGHG